MNWETLLALGDSITIGSRSYLGYPEYAGEVLSQHTAKQWSVHNFAVSRFTCIDLNRHLSTHYDSLLGISPDLIMIMVGTNDAKSPTSLSDFRVSYEQLIVKARLLNRECQMILLKIPPLAAGVMLPYSLAMNQQITAYNEVIDDLAQKHNCSTHSLKLGPPDYYDGVHLNAAGSQAAGKQLAQFILAQREIFIDP